jgi:cytochrome c oxidase subunit 2
MRQPTLDRLAGARVRLWGAAVLLCGSAFPASAQTTSPQVTPLTPEQWPMNYWSSFGTQSDRVQPLLWGLIWLSVIVVAIIAILVVAGIFVRGRRGREPATTPVERSGPGTSWIYIGVGISTLVLVIFTGWTVATMAGIASPPSKPPFTIDVVAHQWWWEFRYEDPDLSKEFVTANEIHIPSGVPVHFSIKTADVIHSFWVPALGGKTDAIPGRSNSMWLEGDKPGIYRGQCSEYCGQQHAQMALRVVVDKPQDYAAWRDGQLAPPAAPRTELEKAGEARFLLRCAACHAVRGTPAGGAVGPDLSHLMSRTTLAAGMLDNNPANLGGWIANPQSLKPGSKMPNLDLSGPELQAIETYLRTLG